MPDEETTDFLAAARSTLERPMEQNPPGDYYLKAIAFALVDIARTLRQINLNRGR